MGHITLLGVSKTATRTRSDTVTRRRQITSLTRTASYRAGQRVQWKGRPDLRAELLKTNRPYAQWLVRQDDGRLLWWWEADFEVEAK